MDVFVAAAELPVLQRIALCEEHITEVAVRATRSALLRKTTLPKPCGRSPPPQA